MQVEHLDHLAAQEIPKVEMTVSEHDEKEAFRKHLEALLQQAFAGIYSEDTATISLVSFGSLASGFGMPGSDMDLAVVSGWKDPARVDQVGADRDIPRLLERAVLDAKMGGRLLTRTRVPILKVCQHPMEELYAALLEERNKWDELPVEEQYPGQLPVQEPSQQAKPQAEVGGEKAAEVKQQADGSGVGTDTSNTSIGSPGESTSKPTLQTDASPQDLTPKPNETNNNGTNSTATKDHNQRSEKHWAREKVLGPLDFPKTGVGIQCDINFENPLGIHNTHLLRCYSLCDPRVQPIVLFVKSWAKTRKINSSYSGTLSSYGWVLMVLHYLVNVAQPPVCPNLQHVVPPSTDTDNDPRVGAYTVRFWRDEHAISRAAQSGQLTHNTQTIGALLRGFFQYYASVSSYGHPGPRPPQFYWTSEVLSLRSPGGIVTKQSKDWVSAKTILTAEKKVTNRYLFAIEDPFEVDHNVARTVTHRGIVAIRDDFRRAWRILSAVGRGVQTEGGLFDQVVEEGQGGKRNSRYDTPIKHWEEEV
ncbi:PAP/OAS1 substrate-binding domain-containing protein [Dothidotthia symphoricarpi CBS 119687]|uniref:polynucleotide adenylyltransferase n=1 Tax=Dothidotthia symphoricarpi CBS 119687 TaxID=1392245 RepID=A0A6A6APQ6_9PLEO|nr:PAP/OAS1 substrate-binding domain-containing protein [Dothidotthia symphoricarpi CBS 119687]KAF2133183.1 PAP/OAS1 substrate-binding domain-containing protein [Dothidotthia symphoricarpi CBS 119687]